MFAELMKAVEKSQAELLEVVEMGQRAAELRSQAFIRELQTEISELKKRCSNLNQLTQSQDHLTFFKVDSRLVLVLVTCVTKTNVLVNESQEIVPYIHPLFKA